MKPLLRGLGRALLVCYVLIVIVMLGIRYWLLPHIDQWRTPIAYVLSSVTNSEVKIGHLKGQWQGVTPEIHVFDVYVKDHELTESIHIPYMMARIKWRGLLQKQLHFSQLLIDGLELALWRDKNLQLHIAGQALSVEQSAKPPASSGFVRWLGQQDQIELQNAQLIWQDYSRDAQVLRMEQLEGFLQPINNQLHFNLRAKPQAGLGQDVLLRGFFDKNELDQGQLEGGVAVQLNGFSARAWRQWIDLPTTLVQAKVDTALQLELSQSVITDLTMDVLVQDGIWESAWGRLQAQSLTFSTTGSWQSFASLTTQKPVDQLLKAHAFQFNMRAEHLRWQANQGLSHEILLDELVLAAASQADQSTIALQELSIKGKELSARIYGTLIPHFHDLASTQVDLTGDIAHLQLNTLHRYFPVPTVSESVVEWLENGLLKGVVAPAQLRWQGRLAQFPYADPTTGLFFVGGAFEQAEIDYYPATNTEKGWPKVEQASGYVALKGNGLWVHADQAVLKPNGQDSVQAERVGVFIDDLSANEPILTIQGQTSGVAQHYLALMKTTDLGSWLDHQFDASTSTGQWQVPLFIRVNLDKTEDIQIQGSIVFDNNTLQLMPSLPILTKVNGRLGFTEQDAQAENLTAWALGGPLRISEQIGRPNQYLKVAGQLEFNQLSEFMKADVLNAYLEGATDYEVKLGFDKNQQFYVQAQSSLVGLSSQLPVPLAMAAQTQRPLGIRWQALNKNRHALHIELDKTLYIGLEQNSLPSPFFKRGGVAWNQKKPSMTKQGVSVDIKHDFLDIDSWQKVLTELQAMSRSSNEAVFPELSYLRLKAKQAVLLGTQVDQLTYTLQQPKELQWRADISSDQVAGTVAWHTNAQGVIQGQLQAELQRFHWLSQNTEAATAPEGGLESEYFSTNWPNLSLKIDDLRMNSWRLGSLRLQGEMHSAEQQWRIPSLSLSTPHGELNAIGTWYLEGKKRGLKLNAQVQSEQVGALLDYVGLEDVLKEGKGAIQAQVFWHGFPWTTKANDIQADFDLSLHQGRVNQVNSRAAKMLEFLSLQSLSRLTRLDFDMRAMTESGFPFDDIKGQARLKQAKISTENIRVVGPVGTIVLEGMTDFIEEQVNLKAVVVPNLDMSGTAIAAGIALNPVLGIGAFVTQLLFKEPLAQAMAVQYHINGDWDQLETEELKLKPQAPLIHYDP